MEPTIKAGQRVKVKVIRPEEVNIGDTVAFSPNCSGGIYPTKEEFIVHRVVDKFKFLDKLYFVHQGDNADWLGMSIFAGEQLIGVADTPSRCHSELKTKNLHLTPYTSHLTLYYFVRKFFIYFFIFKQLAKAMIPAITKDRLR